MENYMMYNLALYTRRREFLESQFLWLLLFMYDTMMGDIVGVISLCWIEFEPWTTSLNLRNLSVLFFVYALWQHMRYKIREWIPSKIHPIDLSLHITDITGILRELSRANFSKFQRTWSENRFFDENVSALEIEIHREKKSSWIL